MHPSNSETPHIKPREKLTNPSSMSYDSFKVFLAKQKKDQAIAVIGAAILHQLRAWRITGGRIAANSQMYLRMDPDHFRLQETYTGKSNTSILYCRLGSRVREFIKSCGHIQIHRQ